eukprot:TRINITY_DN23353_c0_g1_i2.p2 TRINITY_DN23353_c0_g1~~TRINITY_DN23353_c0_g1_i2.p2  ORF type:complete len:160 (+),score=22.82 TRINITY_DN23353_c0_g1_i2:53-532(+)
MQFYCDQSAYGIHNSSIFFFLMIRRPPRSTHCISSAASDVYKRQELKCYTEQGFPVMVNDCYSSMNGDVEQLLSTNRNPSKAKNELRNYLQSYNFEYANGTKVTFDNLPKCKYIFVLEYVIGLNEALPIKQNVKDLAKIIHDSNKAILIFVHPNKIKQK